MFTFILALVAFLSVLNTIGSIIDLKKSLAKERADKAILKRRIVHLEKNVWEHAIKPGCAYASIYKNLCEHVHNDGETSMTKTGRFPICCRDHCPFEYTIKET
jgi:hypothetical protein